MAASKRFITPGDFPIEELPWGPHEWLCRPGVTDCDLLQLVRVTIPPGHGHAFHRHPTMEEIIYVVSGVAQQWVAEDCRTLRAGDLAHIPMNMVHGTYNESKEPLVLLAILSPAKFEGPALIDVSHDEPWRSLRPAQKAR